MIHRCLSHRIILEPERRVKSISSVLIFDLTTKNNKPTLYTTKNLTTAHERRAMKCHDLTSIVVPLQSKMAELTELQKQWPSEKVIAARTKGLGWCGACRIETDVAPTSLERGVAKQLRTLSVSPRQATGGC